MTIPSAESIMGISRQAKRDYEDMLLRWLSAKRDFPWLTEPEPTANFFVVLFNRDRIVEEFNRSV